MNGINSNVGSPTKPIEILKYWTQHVLPTVYDDSLSYSELLNKVVKYLNDVIVRVNGLTVSFEELYNFVDNYFKNLNLQDEVDKWMNDALASGELGSIISKILSFPTTVTTMEKARTMDFVAGATFRTLGYYTEGDGGDALYTVLATQDKPYFESLSNGLFAQQLFNDEVKAKSFGINNSNCLNNALSCAKDTTKKLFIANGDYTVAETLIIDQNSIKIAGESWLTNITCSAETMFTIGTTENSVSDIELSKLHLLSNNAVNAIKCVNWCGESKFSELKIENFTGVGIDLITWEAIVEKCWVSKSNIGYITELFSGARSTSTNFINCFASDCQEGYQISQTYGLLQQCGSDRNKIGYNIVNSLGVSLISCGTEYCDKLVKCGSWWGGSLTSLYGLNNGQDSFTPDDILIDLNSAVNVTISGYQGNHYGNPTILSVTGTSNGNENVTVLDRSIREENIKYVSNFRFNKPISILRSSTTKDFSVTIDSKEKLINFLSNVEEVNCTVTLNLTVDITLGVSDIINLYGIKGTGKIIITGNTIYISDNRFSPLTVYNCSVMFELKDIIIVNYFDNSNQRFMALYNSRLLVNNVTLRNNNVNNIILAKGFNGSTIYKGTFTPIGKVETNYVTADQSLIV